MPGWLEALLREADERAPASAPARTGVAALQAAVIDRAELYREIYQGRAVRGAAVDPDRVRTFIVTTSRVASDGGVLLPDGMDATEFERRPIALWSHDTRNDGIGRWLDRRRITTPEDGWEWDVEFAPAESSELGDRVFRFLSWAGFAGASIGFENLEDSSRPTPEEVVKHKLGKWGWIYRRWKLREISLCHIPADAVCLMRALDGEPQDLRDAARAIYAIDAPPAPARVSPEEMLATAMSSLRNDLVAAMERQTEVVVATVRNLAEAVTAGFAALVDAEAEDEAESVEAAAPASPPAGEAAAPVTDTGTEGAVSDPFELNVDGVWESILGSHALAVLEQKTGVHDA